MNKLISILRVCSRTSCRYPKSTWGLALLFAVLSIFLVATRLEMKTSNLDLVDPEVPEIAQFLKFADEFGTPNVLIVVLEGPEAVGLQAAANSIAPKLETLPGVRNVLYRAPLDPEWLDELGVDEYIMSRDSTSLYLFVQPLVARSSAAEIEPFVLAVREVLDQSGLDAQGIQTGLTGIPEYALNDKEFIQKDVKKLSVLALMGIVLIFVIGFRSWREPFVATGTLVLGCVYTLGLVCFIPGHLSLLSASFISILFGLGIDFGVHVIKRIEEFLKEGLPLHEAIEKGLGRMYQGLLTGALTTALVFFGMHYSGLRGFAELGLIAGMGVLLCFFCMITLLPAGLVLVGPREKCGLAQPKSFRFLGRSGGLVSIGITLLLIVAWLMPSPHFDSNYLELQPKGSEAVRLEKAMVEGSNFSPQFAVFQFNDEIRASRFADRLLDEELVGEVRTLAGLSELGLPPEQLERMNQSFRRQFVSEQGRFAVYAYPVEDVWNPVAQTAFVERMVALDPEVTGMPVIGQYMFEQSKDSLRRVSYIALGLLALCLLLDFRSFRLALAAMLPTLLAFSLMRLWMEVFGLTYNPINIMALPVILGIAVDDGVHIVHRFVQEGGDMAKTLWGTGRTVLLTSLTSMVSFGALSFGAHQGLASFGLLLFIGVTSALIISLCWLPWVLQRYASFWLRKA